MKTEDQTILHKAAIANEKAQDSLSKSQELMLTGDTTEGAVSYTHLVQSGRIFQKILNVRYALLEKTSSQKHKCIMIGL